MLASPSIVNAQSSDAGSDAAPKADQSIWARDKMTGDWGGSRPKLTELGFDAEFRLTQYYQGVTSGGVDTNGEYGGTMDYRLNIDANKLFGTWEGLSITMHVRSRFGDDVNAEAGSMVIQNTGLMMPSPGDYHDTDVTGLTASQMFPFFGGLADVSVGMLDVVDTVNGFFPNLGYGQEGFWNINSTVSALPWFGAVRGLSLYGAIGMTINQEYGIPQSGIIVTGTQNESTSWDSVSNAFDEGAWFAAFHRFLWRMGDKPGYFMIFVGASTAEQASNDPHDFLDIPGQGIQDTDEEKPWDVALYVYQELWQAKGDPNRKLTLFTGGTLGPDNPQFAQWNFFANVELFGFFESRPADRIGVGVWWNGFSDNYTDLVSPVIDLQDLYGFEVYYNLNGRAIEVPSRYSPS
jgi:porin